MVEQRLLVGKRARMHALIARNFFSLRMEGGGTEEFLIFVGLEFGGHFYCFGNLAVPFL